MVKAGETPTVGHVTCSALHAKCARVCVVLGVTGGAVHGGALEDAIYMAILASSSHVFAFEMECKLRVIYLGRFPAIRHVAGSALRAKCAVMFIILGMAGETILRGGLQVRKFTRVDMALGTCSQGVPANQIERHLIMVEGLAM